MAGHSKWSNIKRKKSLNDAKKSKVFTKLVKEIAISAKQGGVDPQFNPRLRLAIQNAKGANVSKDVIARSMAKASDKYDQDYKQVIYEGYASYGVAIIVVCSTEKITRTVANIRSIFTKYGGRLEKSGALAFLFDYKGCFSIAVEEIPHQDELELALIDVEAEIASIDQEFLQIICHAGQFGNVQHILEQHHLVPKYAGLDYLPRRLVALSDESQFKLFKLIDALEDDDDVEKVYHNIASSS